MLVAEESITKEVVFDVVALEASACGFDVGNYTKDVLDAMEDIVKRSLMIACCSYYHTTAILKRIANNQLHSSQGTSWSRWITIMGGDE